MTFLGVLLGLVIMAAIVYMALHKDSNFATRIACLVALGIMVLTLIICLFFILTGRKEPVDESVVIVAPPPPQGVPAAPAETSSMLILVLFVMFMIGLFALVIYQTLKEHRRKNPPKIKENFSY